MLESAREAAGVELTGKDVLVDDLDEDRVGADLRPGRGVRIRRATVGPLPGVLVAIPVPPKAPEARGLDPDGFDASARRRIRVRVEDERGTGLARAGCALGQHAVLDLGARGVDVEEDVVGRTPRAGAVEEAPSVGQPVRVRHAIALE